MDSPRVLILSTVDGTSNEIATSLDAELLSCENDVEYHLWKIDNKYYTSMAVLWTMKKPTSEIPSEGVEALIIHHDPQAENAEEKLNQWATLISACSELDVLLYCCNTISDPLIRDKVMDWCLIRKFELVEINKSDPSEETDLENNKYGINRIIEALHAHMWSNMTFKGNYLLEGSHPNIEQVGERFENIHLSQDPVERLQMESVLDGIMGGENSDFGELFSQLMAMKEHAASLPTNQRRIAAEEIATAFWNAIGGDESEIEDWMYL